MKKLHALLLIAAVSAVVHFAYYGHPGSMVFDEVHFGKFVSSYASGQYYFDIHPPLGKLLIAGFSTLFSTAGIETGSINTPFAGQDHLVLRFLPTLSGVLIPLLIALILFELRIGLPGALFGGLLACLDNALLVQTRSIFLDGFLLIFLLASLWTYLRYRESRSWVDALLCGLLAGAAISIKWTGAAALALPLVWEAIDAVQSRKRAGWMSAAKTGAGLTALALTVYLLAFAVHFTLLDRTGPGDSFMTPSFQKSLKGNPFEKDPNLVPPGFVEKLVELNVRMYTANRDLTATHPYSSPWHSWPAMTRPIYYWASGESRIYLLGNPVLWWASALALFGLVSVLFLQRRRHEPTTTLLLAAWALNFLPFVLIGRVMFLYHYLPAWTFSLMVLVYLLSQTKRPWLWYSVLTGAAAVSFLWFAPLSYGLPLDSPALEARQWFSTWK